MTVIRSQSVQSSGVQQVLHWTQLLEERRVDAHPIDHLFHLQFVTDHVQAEDLQDPRVGQEQG